jgi:electron transfer flavoprotein alpha subunit
MSVLVFVEHRPEGLSKGSLGVLGKARDIDDEVGVVLVGGSEVKALVSDVGRFGATTVHVVEDATFDPPLPQPRVDALAKVVDDRGYDTVLFSNSVLAADIAGGLAARLDAGVNWDLIDIERRDDTLVGKRLALSDSLLVEVGWSSPVRLALFRPGSFEPAEQGGEAVNESFSFEPAPHSLSARIVDHVRQTQEGPSLENAEVIVTAGMGLGGPESLTYAQDLAELLGGVVGATRAVVYAGWCPSSMQIGQTGKTVSPKLYVALGVSGAVQHKVGMQSSQTIIAVNKDPGAPIFEFCDLAVIGDVHTVVPQLIDLLRSRNSS